jgi:hypothetical protein
MPNISTENAAQPEKYRQASIVHRIDRKGKLPLDIPLDMECSANIIKLRATKLRNSDMTGMQILAKTTLTVLGIYAVLTLFSGYPGQYMYRREPPAIMSEILSLSCFTVLAVLVAYFMIFKNTVLPHDIGKLFQAQKPHWVILRGVLTRDFISLLSGYKSNNINWLQESAPSVL